MGGGGSVGLGGRALCSRPLLYSVLLYVHAWQLGGDLQWNFGTQRVSTGGFFFFFGQNPSFWNHMESPSAAATISSRGSSEVIGNARPFITASFLFLKKHNTLLQPSPLLSLLVRSPGTSLSTRMGVLSHCAIWLPAAQESLENWPE